MKVSEVVSGVDFGLILGDFCRNSGILVDFGNPRPIWKENWAGFAKNGQKRPKIAKISQNWGLGPFFGPNGPGGLGSFFGPNGPEGPKLGVFFPESPCIFIKQAAGRVFQECMGFICGEGSELGGSAWPGFGYKV